MLSESVSKALEQLGGEEAEATVKFCLMFDRFFDCLNVSSLSASFKKLKPYRMPYRCEGDFRILVGITDIFSIFVYVFHVLFPCLLCVVVEE